MSLMHKLKNQENVVAATAVACFVASFFVFRVNGLSTSFAVNFQNYILETSMINTSGMSTISALSVFLRPFLLVLVSLSLLSVALSILAAHGVNRYNKNLGLIVGAISSVFSLLFFPTLLGIFFAAAVFVACLYCGDFSNVYARELKKWADFRVGAKAVGKVLMFANIIIVIGLFFSILSAQSYYEASFKQEMTDVMREIALSLPGASLLSNETLDAAVETAISGSTLFKAYITWLPVTAALSVWFILELVRGLLLSNIAGFSTNIMLRLKYFK